ncbi:MAG: amidohydrolase family protein [Candidatus Eiseniibacteriota bacterium]|nr:MAG: amidohydrolase family protein [Candidatus Eisenbacteria bacterium]
MSKKRWIVGVALAIALVAAGSAAGETVIQAGGLVDPESGTVRRDVIIIVKDGKVTSVGPGLEVPAGADLFDLREMYVLPGLFDCHTHLCEMISAPPENVIYGFDAHLVRETLPGRVLQAVSNARKMLESGITTVRDVGNCGEWGDVAVREALRKGLFEGPTTLASGKIITPFGGQQVLSPERVDLALIDYIFADSRDEMRRAVRQNVYFGADWIKIVVDAQRYIYSEEDVLFIVEEAGRVGLRVAAHCMTDEAARNAAAGGVASVEHGFPLSDETLEMMKKHDVWLVGTDFSTEVLEVYGIQEWRDMIVDRLRRAHRIGVRMAFGSDIVLEIPGHDRGSAVLTLLDTWLAAEVPAPDILRALTTDAALFLGLQKVRGSIREGLAADIIAVPRNPLEDILALRDVKFVMKDGRIVRHDEDGSRP